MTPRLMATMLAAAALSGCASPSGGLEPNRGTLAAGALEQRAAQTRTYDRKPVAVLHAVVQALQDSGFQVREANAELGLVTATFEKDKGHEASGGLKALFWYPYLIPFRGLLPKHHHLLVEATANVSAVGERSRVRLSCRQTLSVDGKARSVGPVVDAAFFQQFFASLDKAVFLDEEQL